MEHTAGVIRLGMPCEFDIKCILIVEIYVTQFAKTLSNPAFSKIKIIMSWCSRCLMRSSVAVSKSVILIDFELQG